MLQAKHYVSTKLALFSHDASSVLIMHYPTRNIYGLPGGHVDADEAPDEAIRRELMEELTVTLGVIKRADFFFLKGRTKKIILAYTAIAPKLISIVPTDPQFEYAEWMTKQQLNEIDISSEYRRFILENWPNLQP